MLSVFNVYMLYDGHLHTDIMDIHCTSTVYGEMILNNKGGL